MLALSFSLMPRLMPAVYMPLIDIAFRHAHYAAFAWARLLLRWYCLCHCRLIVSIVFLFLRFSYWYVAFAFTRFHWFLLPWLIFADYAIIMMLLSRYFAFDADAAFIDALRHYCQFTLMPLFIADAMICCCCHYLLFIDDMLLIIFDLLLYACWYAADDY